MGGSRVIRVARVFRITDDRNTPRQFWVHMANFNPSAVARGMGKVVREPSTFHLGNPLHRVLVTTYLPYVAVESYHLGDCPYDIILDEEKLLFFTELSVSVFCLSSKCNRHIAHAFPETSSIINMIISHVSHLSRPRRRALCLRDERVTSPRRCTLPNRCHCYFLTCKSLCFASTTPQRDLENTCCGRCIGTVCE